MPVTVATPRGPVRRPSAAKIDHLQAVRMRRHEDVRRLQVAVGHLQTTMEMTDRIGKPAHQSQRLPGIDRRSTTFPKILQIVGQTDAFNPRQRDINLITLPLPFHDSWKGIALEPAQHSKKLLSRLASGQGLDQKKVAARTGQTVKGEVRFAKWTADSFEQKVVSAADAAAFQIRAIWAADTDRLAAIFLGTSAGLDFRRQANPMGTQNQTKTEPPRTIRRADFGHCTLQGRRLGFAANALSQISAPAIPALVIISSKEGYRKLIVEVIGEMVKNAESAVLALLPLFDTFDTDLNREVFIKLATFGPNGSAATATMMKILESLDAGES